MKTGHEAAGGGAPGRRLRMLADLVESTGIPAELVSPDGTKLQAGQGEPAFRVVVHDESALTGGLDELALGAAYVEGRLDFEGDLVRMFDVRAHLVDRTPMAARAQFLLQLLSAVTSMNRKAISFHYDLGDDFYLTFLDRRHRLYSQGHF
ncbi:MAG TPA: hypothetical protein VLI04_06175, partial [Nocardioidaceae bacterium]|nr:hypothetical protein [Nocardioidaceae bacterium]